MALANQNTGPKEAAVWQPLPSLKALDNKGFVRVQDGHGQTSHFTRWSYKNLEAAPKQDAQIDRASKTAKEADPADSTQASPTISGLHDEDLQALKQLAYERGVAEGRQLQLAEQAAALEANQADTQAQETQHTQALLENIQAAVEGLHEQAALRYEPLKRLALHLAEQLVLTELSISPNGIQRLIERCLDTLDVPAASHVVVDLNPEDLALLQSRLPTDVAAVWRLQANTELSPGSVRVTADDAVVSDLVEDRLAALATTLLQEPQRWKAQSGFEPQRLQSRNSAVPVQDAMPKPSFGTNNSAPTLETVHEPAIDSIEEPLEASEEHIEASDKPDLPSQAGEDHAD